MCESPVVVSTILMATMGRMTLSVAWTSCLVAVAPSQISVAPSAVMTPVGAVVDGTGGVEGGIVAGGAGGWKEVAVAERGAVPRGEPGRGTSGVRPWRMVWWRPRQHPHVAGEGQSREMWPVDKHLKQRPLSLILFALASGCSLARTRHLRTGWLPWQTGHSVVGGADDEVGVGNAHALVDEVIAPSLGLSEVSVCGGRRVDLLGGGASVVVSTAATLAD